MTPGTYIPSASIARAFGIDISANQGLIDFVKMAQASPRPRFAIARTGISWGYKDKFFRMYWQSLLNINVRRSAYHVLYPMESISEQVKNFVSMFPERDFGEGPVVNDCELIHGATRRQLSNACESFSKALEDATGKEVMVYSRFSFVRDNMEYQPWMERRRWIMAAYIDGANYPPVREWIGEPNVIAGYEKLPVAILQTGDKGDGAYYGAKSVQIDTDRWLLGEEEFNRTFSVIASPARELTLEEKVSLLWDAHPTVHPR